MAYDLFGAGQGSSKPCYLLPAVKIKDKFVERIKAAIATSVELPLTQSSSSSEQAGMSQPPSVSKPVVTSQSPAFSQPVASSEREPKKSKEKCGAYMVLSEKLTESECTMLEKEVCMISHDKIKTRDIVFTHKAARDAYLSYCTKMDGVVNNQNVSNLDQILKGVFDEEVENCGEIINWSRYGKLYFVGQYPADSGDTTDLTTSMPHNQWIQEVEATGALGQVKDLRLVSPKSAEPQRHLQDAQLTLATMSYMGQSISAFPPTYFSVQGPTPDSPAQLLQKSLAKAGYEDVRVYGYKGTSAPQPGYKPQALPPSLKGHRVRYQQTVFEPAVRRKNMRICFSSQAQTAEQEGDAQPQEEQAGSSTS